MRQTLNLGTNPDDGLGDTLRAGGDKINDNFEELYSRMFGLGLPIPTDGSPSDVVAGFLFADSDGNLAQSEKILCSGGLPSGEVWLKVINTDTAANSRASLYLSTDDLFEFAQLFVRKGDRSQLDLYFDDGDVGNSVGASASGAFVVLSVPDGFWQIINENGSGDLLVSNGAGNAVVINTSRQVTMASLAGTGTRHVVVDANGKLSAP